MSARARKKPLLVMPPLVCQVPACPQEYPPIGDYADTDRAALLGGWAYRAGQWLCASHRDHIPWWPGRRLALPVREPGATRAEVIGVVPRDVSWSTAALPAPEPDLEPLPPPNDGSAGIPVYGPETAWGRKLEDDADDDGPRDTHQFAQDPEATAAGVRACRCGKWPLHHVHTGVRTGCTCDDCHSDEPPLPQRTPSASYDDHVQACDRSGPRLSPAEMDAMGDVFAGPPAHPWQAAMEAELSEQALAGGEPLESLAPEQEDEAGT